MANYLVVGLEPGSTLSHTSVHAIYGSEREFLLTYGQQLEPEGNLRYANSPDRTRVWKAVVRLIFVLSGA